MRINAPKFTVRVGSKAHASGGKIYDVQNIIKHEQYKNAKQNFDYDIALFQLKTLITYSDTIQKISLPDFDSGIQVGKLCRISGWGAKNFGGVAVALLRGANVPIVNQEICDDDYYKIDGQSKITERMICAGFEDGTIDFCQGLWSKFLRKNFN